MTTCAIYTRVSKDSSGDARSPEQQEAELRGLADRLGWTVGQVFTDAGRSASRYARRDREQYERLLADLDRFDAVAVWDLDRLTRDLGTYAQVRDRLIGSGVLLADRSGVLDLGGRDAMGTGVRALVAEDESRKASARLRRATAAAAAEGRPHGRVPFGYERYTGPDGRPAWREHPEHAATIRQVFARYATGESIRSIAADVGQDPITVTRWLDRPAYVAQRVHRGRVAGPAAWPPLIDQEMWQAVRGRRATTQGGKVRPSGVRHPLSGIAICGVCGAKLRVLKNRQRNLAYICPARGCHGVGRAAIPLERHVTVTVAERIRRDADRLLAPVDTATAETLFSERAALSARADALAELFAEGDLDASAYAKATRAVEKRIVDLDARLASLPTASPLLRPIAAAEDPLARLMALTVPQRREVLGAILGGPVRVMPTRKRNGSGGLDTAAILFPWD